VSAGDEQQAAASLLIPVLERDDIHVEPDRAGDPLVAGVHERQVEMIPLDSLVRGGGLVKRARCRPQVPGPVGAPAGQAQEVDVLVASSLGLLEYLLVQAPRL